MDSLKTAARKVSEVIFPNINMSDSRRTLLKSEGVLSSLPLQICLYYNSTYSSFWMLVQVGCFIYKFSNLVQLYKILMTVLVVVMGIIEISRLYLGYVGNLSEKIPELAGFWMLTIFLQLPLQSFYIFSTNFQILPIEQITDFILIIFLVLEVVIGYFAVRTIASNQALKFKTQIIKE